MTGSAGVPRTEPNVRLPRRPLLFRIVRDRGVLTDRLSGMTDGMTTTKIAVSLPTELVAQVHRAVAEGRAPSVSAYDARTLEEKAKLDDLAHCSTRCWPRPVAPLTAPAHYVSRVRGTMRGHARDSVSGAAA